MKDRYLVIISFFIVIIQTSTISYIEIGGLRPSLPLIFLIIFTVAFGHLKGLRSSIYLGLPLDILIGKGLGTYTALFLIISYAISSIEEKIFKDNFITPLILIVGASFFEIIYFSFVTYLSTSFFQGIAWTIKAIILYSLCNILIGIPLYTFILRKYNGYNMR